MAQYRGTHSLFREVKMDGLAADSKSEEVSYSRQNGSNDPLLLCHSLS